MALPVRGAVPLYLRRRAGALVFTAARLSRHTADGVHAGGFSPRIQYREALRAALHGLVLAAGGHARQLACAAGTAAEARGGSTARRPGAIERRPLRARLNRFTPVTL